MSNIIIGFLILDNIILYILIQLLSFDFNTIITIYTVVILLCVLLLSLQFVLMQANISIKKIYSLLVYLFLSVLTVIISYTLIGSVIKFIKSIALKEDRMNFITKEMQSFFF